VDWKAGREWPGARLMPVALPHGRNDDVGRAEGPVLRARSAQRRADVFGQERLPVELQPAASSRQGTREQVARCGHPGLGRPLCGADPIELRWGLRSPP
jgi:hypothetical protein